MFMKKFLIIFVFNLILFLSFFQPSYAFENPLNVPNNKYGVHILFTEELQDAAKLVNTNGGDWGYVIIPIQAGDRDLLKWQKFMDDAKILHLIPVIRLATEGDYFNTKVWRKPTFLDVIDFSNFLNSLNWPTKNRYIVVFNEPNRGDEWGGIPDPFEYANILNYAATTFKSKSEDFFIISAGLDNAAININGKSFDNYDFMKKMDLGLKGVFSQIDGLGSHSYPNPNFSQPPSKSGYMSTATFNYERILVKSLGGKDIPIFITETGWSKNAVSDGTAASYYTSAFETVWADENIVMVAPFLLKAGSPPFNVFSLLNPDGLESLQFKFIKAMPKIKGLPVFPKSYPLKKILGEKTQKELVLKNFSDSKPLLNASISMPNSLKGLLKWLMKI